MEGGREGGSALNWIGLEGSREEGGVICYNLQKLSDQMGNETFIMSAQSRNGGFSKFEPHVHLDTD